MVISISQVRFDRPVLLLLLLSVPEVVGREARQNSALVIYVCMYVCCVCNVVFLYIVSTNQVKIENNQTKKFSASTRHNQ